MLTIYNTLQLIIIILFLPLLVIYAALKSKYRNRIPQKLGKQLNHKITSLSPRKKTIWIHALSVGEVTSALPLITRLRQDFGDTNIVFSASTKTGSELAEKILHKYCDSIIVFPLDIIYVVKYFLNRIKPDLFILVETDFWPNFLNQLQRRNIPAILVNGRISKKSIDTYRKFHFLFTPLFQTFSALCVQTKSDKKRLTNLGVAEQKIHKIGNLKFEKTDHDNRSSLSLLLGNSKDRIIVAGSTHPGEEEMLLNVFKALKKKYNIRMVVAPRKIERGGEIANLARSISLTANQRSSGEKFNSDVFVLDTIGELSSFYSLAQLCFVGGSLVNEGGHNPIEPARHGKPVLFGPHMEDFEEISGELLQSGGAFCVKDKNILTEITDQLLKDESYRLQCGNAALKCVSQKKGVIDRHIEIIRNIM